MSENDKERNIEKGIATLEALKVNIDNIQKQLATVELSIQEHNRALETMEHYKDMDNDDILVPVGAGVFIGAKISGKKALISIGNDLFTELPIEKIIEKLKNRKKELEDLQKKLTEDLYKLQENYTLLSAQVEEDYRKYLEGRRNVQAP